MLLLQTNALRIPWKWGIPNDNPVFPSKTKLMEEPVFNPLDDGNSVSEYEYKLENISDNKSLHGHNEEWLLQALKHSWMG
jgi:hypothetical protein